MWRIIFGTVFGIAAYDECDPVQEDTVSASLQMKSVGVCTIGPSGPHAARAMEVLIVGSASDANVVPPPPMENPEVPYRPASLPESGPVAFCVFSSWIAATSF